jgi:microsomal dipeptidase-like Zn-dependent dipeptidase
MPAPRYAGYRSYSYLRPGEDWAAGVFGMSAAPHTTISRRHAAHSIESVMDHFTHCADVVSIEHVAFGPDTLYGDHVGLHRVFQAPRAR